MRLVDMNIGRVQEVLGILMESPLYFDLSLNERYQLLRQMLVRF